MTDIVCLRGDVAMDAMPPNDQLTDGDPSVTPELPNGVAGPPFGGALGSASIRSADSIM
jgi:hypothetical protein